jgi:hypothetical protein
MGEVLVSGVAGLPQKIRAGQRGGAALEKAFHAFENLAGRSRRMYNSTKLAAVPHAMSKPASELLHFAKTIGQIRSGNFLVVARK